MKVEIWSDVVCPFCYIGKRKFENALKEFAHRQDVKIEWKSFQLDPTAQSDPNKSVAQSLAEKKGLSVTQVEQMQAHVTQMAAEVDLPYQLDKTVIANTLDAHRLIYLAKKHGLQDTAEERLFAANFIEGKDVASHDVLVQLATEIGLDKEETTNVLKSDAFVREVNGEQYEAQQIGVTGVPFFVFNNKYAVSGAQPSKVFADVLAKVWQEEHPVIVVNESDGAGGSCSIDGNCD